MMLFHVLAATLDAGQVAHLFCCQRHATKEQIHYCLGRGKLVPQFHVVKAGKRAVASLLHVTESGGRGHRQAAAESLSVHWHQQDSEESAFQHTASLEYG